MLKTIKISESTHKALLRIKAYHGYKTIDETIDMCIGEFKHNTHLDLRTIEEIRQEARKYHFDDEHK